MSAGPVVLPEVGPGCRVVRGDSAGVEDQDLGNASQGHQAGRAIASPVGAVAPNKIAGRCAVGD